jgi:hypothetical protein
MRRWSVRTGGSKRRLRMLAWVLPYLVLSLCSGGLHNHPLTHGRSGLTGDGRGASQPAYQTASARQPESESACTACQWLLHSDGYTAASPMVPALGPSVEMRLPSVTQLLTVITLNEHIRAPPPA